MSIVADFEKALSQHSGPSYGRWYAVDLHNHSPASRDFRGCRDGALDEAASHLRETPVGIVMFTDHQRLHRKAIYRGSS